ncbi:MAG: peptidylprolyl isomerase, partial [Bdellovibrionota bacterium]
MKAIIHTNMGKINCTLFPDKAPETVANFAGLATGEKEWTNPRTGEKMKGKPLYSGTVFHRVIRDFMIQGGDPLGNGTGGPGYRFKDEIHPELKFNRPWLLAMANAGPGTNGSQFFITVKETPWLDGKHTIFGDCAESKDIVQNISVTPTARMDRPVKDVTIEKIEVVK